MSSRINRTLILDKVEALVPQIPPTVLEAQTTVSMGTAVGSPAGSTTGSGGASRSFRIRAGSGGPQPVTSGTGSAGSAGDIVFTAGDGGAATGATSTGDGGAGGDILFTPGDAGTTIGGSAGVDGVTRTLQHPPLVFNTTTTTIAITGATALTGAQCRYGIIRLTGTPGAGFTLTTPTGANLQAAFPTFTAGDTFRLVIYNGANDTATITAGATGITLHGTAAVPTTTTVTIYFRNTAANTFDVYQIVSA